MSGFGGISLFAINGAGAFDPTSLALSGFFRDFPGSGSWTGTASAGTSGSNSFSPLVAATSGTALNGHATALFSPGSSTSYRGTASTFASTTAFCGWFLVKPTSLSGVLLADSGGGFLLTTASGTNVQLTLNGAVTVSRSLSTGVYSLVTFRYDGANVQIGVNEAPGASGGASTAAFSTAISFGTSIDLGDDGVNYWDGTMADIGLSKTVLSDSTFNSVRTTYIDTRYGLSL